MGSWENRELCPDGACVGVIGPDGKCNVCGERAPDWSPDRADRGDDSVESDHDEEREPPIDAASTSTSTSTSETTGDPDWDNRTLCPDGSCTGLVSGGGKCSVCGRSAAEIIAESAT